MHESSGVLIITVPGGLQEVEISVIHRSFGRRHAKPGCGSNIDCKTPAVSA